MSDDDWGDGACATASVPAFESGTDDFGSASGGGRGGRGGRGGFGRDRDGGGGGFRGGRGFNRDGGDSDRGGRGGSRGGYRDNGDGEGGRGGRGGGRGGYSSRRNDDGDGENDLRDGGSRFGGGGGRNFGRSGGSDDEAGDGESRRGRGGFSGRGRGGRREDDSGRDNGGEGNKGEEGDEEKPKPYVPPAELEGDEAFSERQKVYGGSGINFGNYSRIDFEVTGDKKTKSISTFEELGLRQLVLANLEKCGYKIPTPIQRHASPQLSKGLDVMACAQTGSGKTAAFLLPIINSLLANQNDLNSDIDPVKPEALILAPTRELAIQIGREARLYSESSILRTATIYGGTAIFSQKNQMRNGVNIMVATPGRLKMFVSEGTVCLSMVKFFVLDEADRMLDMGFMGDVKEIVDKMPSVDERVSGMFSATFQIGVQKAASAFLKSTYIFVTIGVVGGACTDVHQEFLMVERAEKRGKLIDIIKGSTEDDKVLVFCNSKKGADFLAASLSTQGISTTSIHGDRQQSQREQALREFTQGVRKVLVATAVAARGLDIPKVSIVVNYDLPSDVDEYVHRIGRTGRVGHTGRAISFYEEAQDNALAGPLVSILKGAGQEVPDFLVGAGDGGYGGSTNGFSSTDHRGQSAGGGAPKVVEKDEEDWD